MNDDYTYGRGRGSSIKPRDLFLTLCVLKHGGHWAFMAGTFGMKGPTFERLIVGFVLGVPEFIYKNESTGAESEFRMAQLIEND